MPLFVWKLRGQWTQHNQKIKPFPRGPKVRMWQWTQLQYYGKHVQRRKHPSNHSVCYTDVMVDTCCDDCWRYTGFQGNLRRQMKPKSWLPTLGTWPNETQTYTLSLVGDWKWKRVSHSRQVRVGDQLKCSFVVAYFTITLCRLTGPDDKST